MITKKETGKDGTQIGAQTPAKAMEPGKLDPEPLQKAKIPLPPPAAQKLLGLLISTVKNGDRRAVGKILDSGLQLDLDAEGSDGQTAAEAAKAGGHPEILELLVRYGASDI